MGARLKKCILASAAILCVGCAYAVFTLKTGLGIPCVFHLITGLNCPGCGVSRMLLSLLRLDIKGAFRSNAVLFCLSPVLLFVFGALTLRYVRTGSWNSGPRLEALEIALAVILVLWGVVRNLIGM